MSQRKYALSIRFVPINLAELRRDQANFCMKAESFSLTVPGRGEH